MITKNKKKMLKMPNFSKKEIAELTQAAQFAFGNDSSDEFMDKAFAYARELRERREKRGEQSRTE